MKISVFLVLLLVLLAGFLVSCTDGTSINIEDVSVDRPEWKTGDSWTFSCSGGQSREKRVVSFEVLGEEKFKDALCYVLKADDILREYYTYDLNPRARLAGNTILVEVIPELRSFDWPLKVGKKWKTTHVLKKMFSYSTEHADFEVKGMEKIRVPAGRFITFRIVQKNRLRDRIWQEWWYSAKAKWFVKKKVHWRRFQIEEWKLSKYKV